MRYVRRNTDFGALGNLAWHANCRSL